MNEMFEEKKKRKCKIIEFPDELRHQRMPINAKSNQGILSTFKQQKKVFPEKKKTREKETQLNAGSTQRSIKLFCANIIFL